MAGTIVQHFNGQPLAIPRQLTPYTPIDAAEECIGRDEDLKKLAATLHRSPKVVVVNGLGGIGKTTLAKAWFQQALAGYDHFAWIDLAGNDDRRDQHTFPFVEAIAYHPTLAANLRLSFGEKEPPIARFQAIMNALRQLQGRNLLVVDNADQDLEQPDIKSQMPLPPQWQVLVTSRRQLRGYELLRLDRLLPEYAAELFQKHYTGDCPAADLANLLREVDYHTLTVELLAKTLQNHLGSLSLRDLTTKLQRRELADPALQRRISANHSPEETEVYLHLLTTFDCAGLDADERLLLARCAALPPGRAYAADELEDWLQVGVTPAEDAPYLAGPSRRQLHETLDQLDRKGWLTRSPENTFALHRMVQQAVLYQLQPGMAELGVLVETFTKKTDFDTFTNYTLLFQWIPYAEQVVVTLPENKRSQEEVSALINNLGSIIGETGDYTWSRILMESALDSTVKNFGPEHSIVAIRQSNLAKIYRHLGQYEKAQDLVKAALASSLKNFGPEHREVANLRSNLANLYQDLNQYEEARYLLEAALASDLKNFGHDHPTVAIRQSSLGSVYGDLGNYTKAQDLLEAALASDLKNFDPTHPKVAVRQSNLGIVCRNLKQYERAQALLEAALASDLKNFGTNHPKVAGNQINLGAVFKATGEKEKARILFQQAYDLFKKQLGEQHPNTQTAKGWLDGV